MPDDKVTAELAAIRERNDASDVPRLLKALAVSLAAMSDWQETASRLGALAEPERGHHSPSIFLSARAIVLSARAEAFQDCAADLRSAITTALLGEDGER